MRCLIPVMVFVLLCAGRAAGQTAISADGVVESTSGGFQFPDASIQVSAAVAGSAPVEDSGQTLCYNSTGNLRTCAGTGEDGEHQAGVAPPTPRFADKGDGTVADNLTGLIWMLEAECPGGPGTWQQALNWISDLNGSAYACTSYTPGTYVDWRLPNVKELLSLMDYGQIGPALPPRHPFLEVQSRYWTSSSDLGNLAAAWTVEVAGGRADTSIKANDWYVWPVRGGQ